MNKFSILYVSLISLLCTIVGIKFLSIFSIKDIDQIESIITNAFNILTSGTTYSFLLIGSIFITIFGLIFSTIVMVSSFDLFEETLSTLDKTSICFLITFLLMNIIISLYLLLFVILLLLILIFIFYGIYTVATNNSSGGPVHVKGHYRKGGFVRSHTRKRPRK